MRVSIEDSEWQMLFLTKVYVQATSTIHVMIDKNKNSKNYNFN